MNLKSFYKYCTLLTIAVLVSCKAKLPVVKESVATNEISAEKIINQHYKTKKNFQSAYIKADISYKDEKQTQNVSAEIKILKDQKIMVSIRILGFTVAKGVITPSEVRYYEKVGSQFFEGDYTSLSKWLGTDLDFFKVQNLLLGNALDDLKQNKYKATIDQNLYRLENLKNNATEKYFYFESENFLIKKQEIFQKFKNRSISINYPAFKLFDNVTLPSEIDVVVNNADQNSNINIVYSSVVFNQDLNFPYAVPDGYQRIVIE